MGTAILSTRPQLSDVVDAIRLTKSYDFYTKPVLLFIKKSYEKFAKKFYSTPKRQAYECTNRLDATGKRTGSDFFYNIRRKKETQNIKSHNLTMYRQAYSL